MLHAERRDDGFCDPRSPEGVSGAALGRAAWDRAAKHAIEGRILRPVVGGCPGTVQIDVVDSVRGDTRAHERLGHGELNARSIGMGSRHVVSVGAFAIAEERYLSTARGRPLEKGEAGGLADRDAVARLVAGAAWRARQQLERAKSVQRRKAQAVHAADHRSISEARLDQPMGAREYFGAG